MEKTINIQNKAIINGIGNLNNRKCKPVICIDTGEVYTSATDAAEAVGVHYTMMSAVCLGKVKTCKGKHYCYLSEATENLDAIVTRLRKVSTMEADAQKWREYQAREEKRQADIAKAEEKLARRKEICERLRAELQRAIEHMNETEDELNNLKEIERGAVA